MDTIGNLSNLNWQGKENPTSKKHQLRGFTLSSPVFPVLSSSSQRFKRIILMGVFSSFSIWFWVQTIHRSPPPPSFNCSFRKKATAAKFPNAFYYHIIPRLQWPAITGGDDGICDPIDLETAGGGGKDWSKIQRSPLELACRSSRESKAFKRTA